jgi:NAD(P)-dependent dehydrogenase (short-subunit alcohol dehydrogenase family)
MRSGRVTRLFGTPSFGRTSVQSRVSCIDLTGRNALVTGVSRRAGIGYAITQRLLDAGAGVFIHGWTPHDATQRWGAEPGGTEAIAAELAVPFLEADFADAEAPERVVAAAPRRSGRPTSLSSTTLAAATAGSTS